MSRRRYKEWLRYAIKVAMDPRQLPRGEWEVEIAASQAFGGQGLSRFSVAAVERGTRDVVTANVISGYRRGLGGLDNEDWDLPECVEPETVWCLQRIEPRKALAKGGTGALLDALAQAADTAGRWLITDVDPHDDSQKVLVIRTLKKRGFSSFHPEYKMLMRRAPRP